MAVFRMELAMYLNRVQLGEDVMEPTQVVLGIEGV